jgi:hypothetical protein
LVPFNPERVLRDIPRPHPLTISIANDVRPSSEKDEQLRTPTTPATSEALMSLQNLIMKQDAHALDAASKTHLQRHVQKFVKAAQTLLAKNTLQQDRIRFLIRINNEAKTRRSTKADILGRGNGRIISFEDLQVMRAERAAMEQAKAKGKGKRGRKRKSAMETEQAEIEAGPSKPKAKIARTSGVEEPWQIPVAPMFG